MRLVFLWSTVVCAAALIVAGCRDEARPTDSGTRLDGGTRTDSGPPPACDGAATSEDTAEACSNGCDDDGDGYVDCDDFDCEGIGSCTGDCTPTTDRESGDLCDNSIDDDCDGFVDCDDFGCDGSPACPRGPVEASNPTCSNGIDDDGDGFIDCDDTDCVNPQRGDTTFVLLVCGGEVSNAACSDGIDNDGDSMIDCADPDCQREAVVVCDGATPVDPLPAASTWPALVAAVCTNGVDDDASGFTDCFDNNCRLLWDGCGDTPLEQSNATCSDGIDNDGDGFTDCADTRCQGEGIAVCSCTGPAGSRVCTDVTLAPAEYTTASNARCSDGLDSDGNGFTDCADFSCSQNPDVTVCTGLENTDALCSDGIDNDGDGFIDCNDNDCRYNPFVTVCESGHDRCSNTLDDDGNGFADCQDFACTPTTGVTPACYRAM